MLVSLIHIAFFVFTIFTLCRPVSCFAQADGSGGAKSLTVLPQDRKIPQTDEMMRRYLRGLANEALDRRLEQYEKLKTPEQITEYQRSMRQFFIRQLGGLPQRTPLNARIVGEKTYSNYRIEKIIYESAPGFYIPAIFYLPLSRPPYPAVLLPCGHTENGKASETYQRACILLAINGIAVLCPDPIGQGERKQILNDDGQGRYPSTTEHMITGIAPILLGRNLATYMIWDEIRGIDYLLSRPEIDKNRIGCTGNSGGGNRTSYLMALDERIVSAAPGCFITTTRRKDESPGPGDAEQNIHAQIAYGMDHPDYIIMRAPQPTLILSATNDFVPIEGAWEAFRQAKRIYTRLGFPERVSLIETDDKHGFSLYLREGMARWMRRWLLESDDAVTEPNFPIEADQELRCTPDGQTLLMPGAKSIFDLNIEYEQQLAEQRHRLWTQGDTKKILAKVRDVTGVRKLQDLPRPTREDSGSLQRQGYRIEKLILRWQRDIELPALLFRPDKPNGEVCLYVHGQGKHVDAYTGGPIESIVRDGNTVLAVDVRGCGETCTTTWRYGNAREFTGNNTAEYFIAYMLGKSFLGMRAEDMLVSASFLAELSPNQKPRDIHMVAVGEAGPAALHAAALETELFDSLTLRQSLASFSNVVSTPVARGALVNCVHGALELYDLPDLVSVIGSERVTIEKAVNADGQVVTEE